MSNSDHAWLQGKLRNLLNWAKGMSTDEPVTQYCYFTALKLIAVSYYASVFVKVVKNQIRKHNANGAVYIDLLAGTGLVRIKDAKPPIHIAGSPTCAASTEHGGFDYIVCVESDRDRCDALTSRLGAKMDSNKFDVIQGDCNQKIDDVIHKIQAKYDNPIVLVFVDPEAFEIKFRTLASINAAFKRCDFMIHVNSSAVRRERGKIIHKSDNASPKILEKYFDMPVSEIFKNLATKSPEQQYVDLVEDKLGKKVGDTIDIRDTENHIAYHILCYTRETKGGSGYADSIKKLKENLEKTNAKLVRQHLDILHNGQETLGQNTGGLDAFMKRPT